MIDSEGRIPANRRGRRDLLVAAADLFMEQGYDATSMSAIAERVGVTKAALYKHVSGKAELLVAVTLAARTAVLSLVAEVNESEGSATYRLEILLYGLAGLAESRTPGFPLIWGHAVRAELSEPDAACREVLRGTLVALLEQAGAEGAVRGGLPPYMVAQLILGSMAEVSSAWQEHDSDFAGDITSLLIRGMAVPGRRGSLL